MSLSSRREYLQRMKERYRQAAYDKKTQMLDDCCSATGLNRKYLISCLSAKASLTSSSKRKRKTRAPVYDNVVTFYLKKIWVILDYPCGERLKPMLPEMVVKLRAFGELDVPEDVEKKLAKISHATIDKKLERFRTEIRRRIQGTTKPG